MTKTACLMKNVSEGLVDLFAAQTVSVDPNSFVKTEFVRLDVVPITLAQKISLVSTNNVQILARCLDNADLVLIAMFLITEFNVVAPKECLEILSSVVQHLLSLVTATVNVMNQNVTVLQNVKPQTTVLVDKFVNEEIVDQNVTRELVPLVNFVKEMSALKDVVLTQIVRTICHVSTRNVSILVLKTNVVKKQFVVQQIIVRFVFVLMDLLASLLSNAYK